MLRRETYSVPVDKLVVVVADFSSGNLDDGREIADEVAHHLNELKKHGIDIHVLAGEIKPGVIIRSEEMAQDVGRHFPPDTSYVVIWGTMSTRTVGRYRPYLTCVRKYGADRGASMSFTMDLQSQELPLNSAAQNYQRECFSRLIGVTCAAIPSCFAAHEISHERTPDLSKFYALLGPDSPDVKQLQEGLQPLTRWTNIRTDGKLDHLRALGGVSEKQPFPTMIRNMKDESLMTLITEDDGSPKRFANPATGTDEIVYIDVTETTNRLFLKFLNDSRENREEGGTTWIRRPPDHWDLERGADSAFRLNANSLNYVDSPVIHVSWFGAKAYCRWAGKDLPRQTEWQAAARPKGVGNYPWGNGFDHPEKLCNSAHDDGYPQHTTVGTFKEDCSRIGCFDMAGNVAEWCDDWFDESKSKERMVCGGSCNDKDPKLFEITARRGIPPVAFEKWVGFRGVVRIPVGKESR